MRTKDYDITSGYFIGSIYENLKLGTTRVILRDDGVIISRSDDTEKYNFYDFYEDYCRGGYFDQLDIPHIVSTGMGTLYNLEKIEYDDKTIDYLNEKGLHIYLQEALLLNFGKKKRLVFKENHIKDENQIFLRSLVSFYQLPKNIEEVYCFEFDSVDEFASKNRLRNITIFTNELDVGNILGTNYPKFKFASFNNWVMTYKNDFLDSISYDQIHRDRIEKKMLALSLRYEPHKHLINSYLIDEDNEISWYENRRDWDGNGLPDLDYLNTQMCFNLLSWKQKYPNVWKKIYRGNQMLGKRSPIILKGEDEYLTDLGKIPCGTGLKLPVDYHAKSFCYIVNETKYGQPFGYFSEKTINSMACLRPFVLVAPPYSLRYLKLLGFKTFDRWWDESYDQEEDHELRMLKIFKIIDFIQSKSVDELKVMWDEMKDVLHHNSRQIEISRKEYRIIYG